MREFDTLLRSASAALTALPGIDRVADHPVLADMAAIVAMSECELMAEASPHSVVAAARTLPDASRHASGAALAHAVEHAVAMRFTGRETATLRDELGMQRAASLSAAMLAAGATGQQAMDLFETVSQALQILERNVATATTEFLATVLRRDLGMTGNVPFRINGICNWALCHDLDGRPGRADAIMRRIQALDAYGAVHSVLMRKDITAAIDEGREMAPLLMAALSIDRSRLARINGTMDAPQALISWQDRIGVVQRLALHDVPVHRWPVELRNDAWTNHNALLEPAYLPDASCRDALSSFMRDIVQPLAAARAKALGLDRDPHARRFISTMLVDEGRPMAERTAWLKTVKTALLDGRGPKAFGEAAAKWHRRVASISALRLEHAAPTPGWPALCETWTSPDGRATITPIVTAEGLVEEGNTMRHCVGGYYPECRSGRTHILSYAVDGRRMATLELLATVGEGRLTVRQGQFEGLRRVKPGDDAFAHVRTMLEQIRSGAHKVDVAKHERYAAKRAREYEYDDGSILPIEFVRRAWPLYLALMPRGTPTTFDEWAETTPLVAAMDREIGRVHAAMTRQAA